MATQLFVDENKRDGFVMIAVEYRADAVKRARAQLIGECRPGQRRIHFKSENDRVRDRVLGLLCSQGVAAHVFRASSPYEPQARADCIGEGIGPLAIRSGANRLVIERDETRDADDRRVLTTLMRSSPRRVPWELLPPETDPLLWSADAIAWCYTNPKPAWRQKVAPLIASLTEI